MNSGRAGRETFSRDDRLRKRREFEECYASGVRVSGRHIQLFLSSGVAGGKPRLGISVPRRVGNAVQRNRVRRRLREIFRRTRGLFGNAGFSVVIHARPSAADMPFQELAQEYTAGIARALARLARR